MFRPASLYSAAARENGTPHSAGGVSGTKLQVGSEEASGTAQFWLGLRGKSLSGGSETKLGIYSGDMSREDGRTKLDSRETSPNDGTKLGIYSGASREDGATKLWPSSRKGETRFW